MERYTTIDVVKCFAVFIVVCLHTVTYGYDWQSSEHISFIIGVFPRWVIPFFFIVSGYFFGQKVMNNFTSKAYFSRYMFKLIGLFITWYLFYLIYDLILRAVLAIYMGLNVSSELNQYIKTFVNIDALYYGEGMTSYHLWYLTALIWSIVILYVFIRIRKLGLLLILGAILNIIGLFGQTYTSIFHLPIQTKDALFFGVFYTTLGCYIAFHYKWIMQKVRGIKSRYFIYLILLFSLIQVMERLITVFVLDGERTIGDYYLSTAPLTLCFLFIALKNKSIGPKTFIAKMGKNAVGIYVSHLFIISIAALSLNFMGLEYLRNNILFNLIFALVIFIFSYYFYKVFNLCLYRINLLFSLLRFGNNTSKNSAPMMEEEVKKTAI
ncbi:acyltransferase [Virgibacillus salinus]|uniref:Surface polysaccharide O-acyltransferase, integral membrane enzyme n=1 Tax=Virgibacillus salinus TaxID=553311 RepID=A0A1H0Y4N1_9BACI|nr:acyltransferase [Virgibacillus salinus]SDQ10112.1 Surface polysaccharide O-acyltransferase, integral membrane enzyme [Virgibacillus salinus]